MTKEEHIEVIRAAMAMNGTNKPQYDIAVEALAAILERRDEVEQVYLKHKQPIIKHTNKAGATNWEQNPALRMLNDCNKCALLYMRELGLTPQALRRINPAEAAQQIKSKKSLIDTILEQLEGADYDEGGSNDEE